jgi:hypothetical protein
MRLEFALISLAILVLTLSSACSFRVSPEPSPVDASPPPTPEDTTAPTSTPPRLSPSPSTEEEIRAPARFAHVIAVDAGGEPGAYRFSVTISSPDSGCDQYADWWEVLSEEGELLYRRVLLHSHVDEQPFTRSGGPVELEAHTPAIIRAHMSTSGYGGRAFRGSVKAGFSPTELDPGFAADLSEAPPLPDGCAF